VFRCVLGSEGCVLVPRSSGTPVATWAWPTWVVCRRRVLEALFILLEFLSPSRRIFIGSHSLPPSLVRRIGPSVLRKFLRVSRSIHFVGGFCCTKFADGPYLSVGRSVAGRTVAGPSRTIRYCGCSTGGSGAIFRQSVVALRTVRLGLADGPPGACRWSAWCLA
jgi:hypothetical protein